MTPTSIETQGVPVSFTSTSVPSDNGYPSQVRINPTSSSCPHSIDVHVQCPASGVSLRDYKFHRRDYSPVIPVLDKRCRRPFARIGEDDVLGLDAELVISEPRSGTPGRNAYHSQGHVDRRRICDRKVFQWLVAEDVLDILGDEWCLLGGTVGWLALPSLP